MRDCFQLLFVFKCCDDESDELRVPFTFMLCALKFVVHCRVQKISRFYGFSSVSVDVLNCENIFVEKLNSVL